MKHVPTESSGECSACFKAWPCNQADPWTVIAECLTYVPPNLRVDLVRAIRNAEDVAMHAGANTASIGWGR